MASSPSRNDIEQGEVVARGRVDSRSHLGIPEDIQHVLFIDPQEDMVEYIIDRRKETVYIRKKPEHSIPYDGEILKEVSIIYDRGRPRWLSLPSIIRHMLWLQVGDYIEYIRDPFGRTGVYLRREKRG